ncbi:MAG TPA: alpha/beta hydrolase [Chitinophagaceae bacterium]|nr:alpha/beta hydrolase [Chitinophagaceae bacterium]
MQKQIDYKGVKIFYKIIGQGKPVFLIHGFSEDGDIWKYQIEHLKAHYQLIVADLPGSGYSPVNNLLRTIDDFADGIKAIADNESIKDTAMIGHSMGGYITLAFAEKYPQLLNRFGLFHSTVYADNEEKIQTRKRGIEFIKQHGAHAFLKQSIPKLFTLLFSQKHPQQIADLMERGKLFSSEVLVQYYEAMISRPDRTSVLKKADKPILFIIGTEDKAVPLQESLKQCHQPSVSDVHILENTAHMGMWEEKDKCNLFITNFLSF